MAIKSMVFFLAALLFFASGAWARPTTEDEARSVAEIWLSREAKPMGSPIGHEVKKVETFTDETGVPAYYVVYLAPSGLIFLPADDLVEPIIGFVSGATSYDPSPKNPLGALVSRDIPGRVAHVRETKTADARMAKAQTKWARLTGTAGSGEGAGPVPGGASDTFNISDVQVAPFLQVQWKNEATLKNELTLIQWNQACTISGTPPCSPTDPDAYNFYTPPNAPGNYNNDVCGCVATAMAQVMRYFKYPIYAMGPGYLGGDGKGGPYDWANMPPTTNPDTPLAQRQAIGRLTRDAGVSVGMDYGSDNSGAYSQDIPGALMHTFQYSQAAIDGCDASISNPGEWSCPNKPEQELYTRVNPNLIARKPVIFGIHGDCDTYSYLLGSFTICWSGHEIVCDGYGYNTTSTSTSPIYHHLNMGWRSLDDAWYNLPTIDAVGNNDLYTTVSSIIYNIYPTGPGGGIIAGGVSDAAGNPLKGADVMLYVPGAPPDTAAYTLTDAKGLYAFTNVACATQTNYAVTATLEGYTFPVITGIPVGPNVAGWNNAWLQALSAVAGAPTAPTGVNAKAEDAQATVSFNAPASYGGVHLAKYTVYQSPGTAVTTGTTSPIIVKGLKNGTAYTFRVTATNAGERTSPKSGPSNKVTPQAKPTTTTVGSGENTSTYGQSVTLKATVTGAGGTPTGSVTFMMDGTTTLGTGTLNDGKATYATPTAASAPTVGKHTISAKYNGDDYYAVSTGTLSGGLTVNQASSQTKVTSSRSSSYYGAPLTFSAFVSGPGAYATGKVQFEDANARTNIGGPVTLVNGYATTADDSLSVGNHTITAIYYGDSNYTGSTGTLSGGQSINKVVTETVVTSSANTSTYGQSVTFTATVSPMQVLKEFDADGYAVPTGAVTFKDGNTTLGTGVLSGGQATYATSSLAVGKHNVAAYYNGDQNCAESSWNPSLAQTVNPVTVTPSISASNKTYDGTTTASVTGSLSGVISGDAVSLKTPITANFASKNAGTGITVTATGLSLTGSSAANYALSSTTATTTGAITARAITVTAASNTKVYDGKTSAAATPTITSGSLASGDTANFIETYNTPNGGTGKTLTPSGAVNDGNGGNNYAVTFVSNTTGVIYQAGSTMGVTSSSNPSAYGQAVTFTVTVTGVPGGATPTGTVQFVADVTIPSATVNIGGPVSLSNGSAVSPAISNLAVGDHSIVANYIGDANYTSNAGTLSGGQTVKTTASTTSLTSSANPSTYGQSVTFTATVSPSTATGTVTFMDSTSTLGTGTLSGGKATYATSTLAAATHSITAVYGGDTNDATSTSSVFTQTVNKASSTTGISSSENPSNPGDSITFEAGVTGPGGYPTGTVQFVVDGSNFGSPVSLSISRFGELTFDSATSSATSSLSSGNHTVAAVYSGDNNYTGSSATLSGGQTVKTPTTLSLSSSENPSVVGNPVTFTAMLNIKNAAPTGTVQFQVNGTNLGTAVPVSNRLLIHIPPTYSNSATSEADSFPNPEGGNYTITATYSGDNNYMGSIGTMNESVNQPPPK
jgi:hypothetical protein